MLNTPLRMLLVMLAGWMNEQQRAVNAYLKEENRVLRAPAGHGLLGRVLLLDPVGQHDLEQRLVGYVAPIGFTLQLIEQPARHS